MAPARNCFHASSGILWFLKCGRSLAGVRSKERGHAMQVQLHRVQVNQQSRRC